MVSMPVCPIGGYYIHKVMTMLALDDGDSNDQFTPLGAA